MNRVILHCDCNSFFASVELLSLPHLKNVPMAVCGNPENRHGIILAKNEAAKAFGVVTAQTIWQAQSKCPNLVLVPPHHDQYKKYSKLIGEIYYNYTDQIEPFGIDESWLDATGSLALFGCTAKQLADKIREHVKSELGLTISVGVSFNKIFAKLGSDYKKPDATTLIDENNYQEIVFPLPVTDLLFVGPSCAKVLAKCGVTTIGQLAAFDKNALISLLGKQGEMINNYANGIDPSPVASYHQPPQVKSVGNGTTFKRDITGLGDITTGVVALADQIASRLRQNALKSTTLQVTIKDPSLKSICRQKKIPPTYLAKELAKAALEIIQSQWPPNAPIRMLTLTASNLVPKDEFQPSFFFHEDGKQEALELTVDAIRNRFGNNKISSAQTLGNDLI